MQDALKTMGKDYLTVKEFLMKYSLRAVDTVAATAYDVVEAPVKALYDSLDKKVFTPITEYVKANPWKVALASSLVLGAYTSSLFYASGYPLFA